MSTDLKEKPSGIYDDEQSRADKQAELKALEEDFAKPAIGDEDRNTSADGESTEDIKNREANSTEQELTSSPSSSKQSKSTEGTTAETGSSASEGFYRNSGGRKGRFSIKGAVSSTKARIAIAAATAVIAGFAALTSLAPSILINNIKQVLLGKVSNVQIYNERRYRQTKMSQFKNYFSRDGRMTQKIITEMAMDGYKPRFVDGKLVGMELPSGRASLTGTGLGDHIEAYMERKHPLRTARWKTNRMNAFYKKNGVSRTSIVNESRIRAGPDGQPDYDRTINSELAKEVLEGEDPSISRSGGVGADEEPDPNRQRLDESYDETSGFLGEQLDEGKQQLLDGDDISEVNSIVRITSEAGDTITPELVELAETAVKEQGALASAGKFFKGFLVPTDALDHICTLRNRLNGAVKLARAGKAIKMIRYAKSIESVVDDTQTGKSNAKLINSLFKRASSEDINGVPLGGSTGWAYATKGVFSKSKNNATKAPVAVDGKLTGTMGGVHNEVNKLPGLSACPVVQNPVAQVGVAVGSIALAVFSGGGSAAIQSGFQVSVTTGIKKAFTEVVESVVTKQALRQLAFSAVGELSFTGIMMLAELQVQKSLNVPFTGQEKGGQFSDILVAGAGTANKQRSLLGGMVPATTTEYAQANNEYLAWKKQEDSQKSIMARTFATDDPNSLLVNVATAMPVVDGQSIQSSFGDSMSLVANLLNPGNLVGSLMSKASPKVDAMDGDMVAYDELTISRGSDSGKTLATDPAGNLQVIMRADIEAIDPETNRDALIASGDIDADTWEPKSKEFTEHIGYCVDTPDTITSIEENKGDCMAQQQKTKQFKAHLAFLNLDDSLKAEFFPEEINDKPTSSQPPTETGSLAVAYTNPITEDLTSVIPGTNVRVATNILPQLCH